MANRNKHLDPSKAYNPPRCWVGDTHKIIYDTLEEAELAALAAAYDHHLDYSLKPYKCPYAPHYHLASSGGRGSEISRLN